MGERIDTLPIDTSGSAKNQLVQKDPCQVHWITVTAKTSGTRGSIKLYDGFDDGGKLKWLAGPYGDQHFLFDPPITCDQGCYVVTDDKIVSYTIGYRPSGWPARE